MPANGDRRPQLCSWHRQKTPPRLKVTPRPESSMPPPRLLALNASSMTISRVLPPSHHTECEKCGLRAQPRRKFEKNQGRLPPAILPHPAHGSDGARGLGNRLPAEQQGLHGRVRRLAAHRRPRPGFPARRGEHPAGDRRGPARLPADRRDLQPASGADQPPGGLQLRPRAQAAGVASSNARSPTKSPPPCAKQICLHR